MVRGETLDGCGIEHFELKRKFGSFNETTAPKTARTESRHVRRPSRGDSTTKVSNVPKIRVCVCLRCERSFSVLQATYPIDHAIFPFQTREITKDLSCDSILLNANV